MFGNTFVFGHKTLSAFNFLQYVCLLVTLHAKFAQGKLQTCMGTIHTARKRRQNEIPLIYIFTINVSELLIRPMQQWIAFIPCVNKPLRFYVWIAVTQVVDIEQLCTSVFCLNRSVWTRKPGFRGEYEGESCRGSCRWVVLEYGTKTKTRVWVCLSRNSCRTWLVVSLVIWLSLHMYFFFKKK